MEPTAPPPRFRPSDPLPPAPEAYESLLATTEKPPERRWLHLLLFLLTLGTTVWAGGALVQREVLYAEFGQGLYWWDGLRYAFPLLLFLTVHEFGHYFAARLRGVDVTLPYYIPVPIPPSFLLNFGTFGAVIRIREPLRRTRQLFDIGAAGPLAGFVVALGVLVYALATLPPPEYVFGLGGHDTLKLFVDRFGAFPDQPLPDAGLGRLTIGQTPLYWALTQFFPNVPPMYEMYHYPVLFAGWLGLFFTALNMLPVGQLDGGHILYALAGPKWHGRVARAFVLLLLFSATLGLVTDMGPALRDLALYNGYPEALGGAGVWMLAAGLNYFFVRRLFETRSVAVGGLFGLVAVAAVALRIGGIAEAVGYMGWYFWCFLIVTLIKVDHPPVTHPEPLTPGRRALGILALVLLVLCFSFKPLYLA